MGSCCSQKSKESSPKSIPKNPSKIPTSETENTQVFTTSSFRYRCISPRSRKKERISLQSITKDYLPLSKKAEIIPEKVSQKLQELRKGIIEPKEKLRDLLVIPPESYMICKVCDDILLKPQLCSKCNLFICAHCFESSTMICKHSVVNVLNDYYQNIIEILSIGEFKCFNWKNGCCYLLNYSKINFDKKNNRYSTKHELQCVHKMEKCTNPTCSYQGYSQDYINHVRQCSHSSFFCFYCKEKFNRREKENHYCFNSKPMAFSLPIRYCECGAILDWIVRKEDEVDTGRSKAYYQCSQCKEAKMERQCPSPISKVCGCFSKLKGGIIHQCSSCNADGGIGWSCNLCGNKINICEACLTDKLEINMN